MSGNSDGYKMYIRTNIAEMSEWNEYANMEGVSVSDVDKSNGSPKLGDMIARNPKNHDDKWLVAKKYFEENFAIKPDSNKNGWIAIKDRKPKVGERVLVYDIKEDNIVISRLLKGDIWVDDDESNFALETVSHWMEIPKFKK